jgi:hypothetical protein
MLEDRNHPLHPSPGAARLRAEAEREAAALEAAAHAERVKKATDAWRAYKNELAALIDKTHRIGTWSRGYHLAHIEDADMHVLSILEDV